MEIERRVLFEEIANSLTHGIGLILSLVGLIVLVALTSSNGSVRHITGCSVYGASLVLVYGASTLYHSIQKPKIKHYCRIFDQSAIYLVIAGTYTPFTLVNLHGFWGSALLMSVWFLAIFGIAFKLVFVNRYAAVSMALYLIIAWLAIFAAK